MSVMKQQFLSKLTQPRLKPLFQFAVVSSLVLTLFLNSGNALAARSGGRVGGGSFTRPVPSRPYSSPNRGYPGPAPYYPGGGFGFPFLIPFLGIGGFGSIFSILIFIFIAQFLFSTFRRVSQGGEAGLEYGESNPNVSINTLQVGLLAEARELQADLDRIAQTADTSSSAGLSMVLQEAVLALLRHPEYWVYANSSFQQKRWAAAEAEYNRLLLAERSKLSAETLSNFNDQRAQSQTATLPQAEAGGQLVTQAPGEYIVVSVLTASEGKLELPRINNHQELRQALNVLGSIPTDKLLTLQVLWQPQAAGDTLSSEEVIAAYPDLKLL